MQYKSWNSDTHFSTPPAMKVILLIVYLSYTLIIGLVLPPKYHHHQHHNVNTYRLKEHPFSADDVGHHGKLPISPPPPPPPPSQLEDVGTVPIVSSPMKYLCMTMSGRPTKMQPPEWVYGNPRPNSTACLIIGQLKRDCAPDIKTWSFAAALRDKFFWKRCKELAKQMSNARHQWIWWHPNMCKEWNVFFDQTIQ